MNRFGIKRISSVTLLTIGCALVSLPTIAPLEATTVEDCAKEYSFSFFPEDIVSQVLQKYQVSKDKWDPILKGLKEKNEEVLKLTEEAASKQDPNPLKDPSQKQVLVKIYRESLLQVFSGVLMANGVTDSQKIQSMLGEIQQIKTRRFAQCVESHKPAANPAGTPGSDGKLADNNKKKSESKKDEKHSDDDDDDDDDEDDDEDDEDEDDDKGNDESDEHQSSIAASDMDEVNDDEDNDYHY